MKTFPRVLVVMMVSVAALLAQKPDGEDDGNGDSSDDPPRQQSAPPRRSPMQGDENDDEPSPVATNLFFSAIERGTNGVALAIDWTPAGIRFWDDLIYLEGCTFLESNVWHEIGAVDVRGAGTNVVVDVGFADFPSAMTNSAAFFRVRGGIDTTDHELDSDGDGLADWLEEWYGTDPLVADSDGDGLLDGDEVARGTDPVNPDTDGDGVNDGDEVDAGTNPFFAPETLVAPEGPHFTLSGANVYTTVYDNGDGTTRTETATGATDLEFVESWADPYVRTGAGLSFEPSHTGIYTFQLASADDVIDVTIGDLVVHGEFYGDRPETNALFIAGHSYPITVRTENYGGPAALAWQKFAEFSPVPRARLDARFSRKTVIFENYRHGNPAVPNRHRSTKTVLEIFANGGALGGTVSYSILNDSKLMSATTFGRPQSSQTLNESDTFALRFPYKGCGPSTTRDDIKAIVRLEENVTHEVSVVTAAMTSVELRIEATERFPANRNRHVYGLKETARIWQTPTNVTLACDLGSILGGAVTNAANSTCEWVFTAPQSPTALVASFTSSDFDAAYNMNIHVVAPEYIYVEDPYAPTDLELGGLPNPVNGVTNGESGVFMCVRQYVYPDYVSFKGMRVWEGECDATNRTGIFADLRAFPEASMRHDASKGAVLNPREESSTVQSWRNELDYMDIAGFALTGNATNLEGTCEWHIPIYWTMDINEGMVCQMSNSVQKISLFIDGSMKVEKCGASLKRYINGRIE